MLARPEETPAEAGRREERQAMDVVHADRHSREDRRHHPEKASLGGMSVYDRRPAPAERPVEAAERREVAKRRDRSWHRHRTDVDAFVGGEPRELSARR